MGIVSLPSFGSDPATITASNLDGKVDPLATEFNGNIENSNIKSSAAIANSKLNLASIAQSVTMSSKDFTEAKGANVASAATTTIWVTDGNFIHITGTETITSFGTAAQAGDERTLVFDGAATITHNATSLILPDGINITTVAGDTCIVRAESTANARIISYTRKVDARAIEIVFDNANVEIEDNTHIEVLVPDAIVITGAYAFADVSGSIEVDIWKDTIANYPPTVADTIVASAPVTISSDTNSTDTTLTGWTTAVAALSVLKFVVNSCTTITKCTIVLTFRRP